MMAPLNTPRKSRTYRGKSVLSQAVFYEPSQGFACAASGAWITKVLVLLGLLTAVLALVIGLCFAPQQAYAEENENLVNPQQRPDSSFIYDTSIASLGAADAYYDNQTVQVVGEAIGDNISAGADTHHRWITLAAVEKDSTATVSVFMTNEAAGRIDTYGRYGTVGTKLQVRGIFHLVCPQHEGLTDIHADIVSVVEKGKHHNESFKPQAFIPGALMVVVGLVLMGVFYYLRERQR